MSGRIMEQCLKLRPCRSSRSLGPMSPAQTCNHHRGSHVEACCLERQRIGVDLAAPDQPGPHRCGRVLRAAFDEEEETSEEARSHACLPTHHHRPRAFRRRCTAPCDPTEQAARSLGQSRA